MLNAGKWAEAITAFEKLSESEPANATIRYNLGFALQKANNKAKAVTQYLAAVALDPKHASALNNCGNLLNDLGHGKNAMDAFRRTLEIEPDHMNALKMLGVLSLKHGTPAEAVRYLRRAAALAPKDLAVQFCLAQAKTGQHRLKEAAQIYEGIISIQPNHSAAHNNLASILKQQGLVDEALVHWHHAYDANPTEPVLLSNIILSSHYTPNIDAKTRLEQARSWGRAFGDPVRESRLKLDVVADPDRPLRVGYISSDFHRHPIGFFMTGVFANHNQDQFKVYAYSATSKEDDLTIAFRDHASVWRKVTSLDATAIAKLICEDRIDILVDLAGHAEGNWLRVLALKPAPVQAIAGGHFCTTGLDGVDYAISDSVHSPPGSDGEFTESLIRLPDGYICYTPPPDAPDVGPLPALAAGHVTFGCLNNIAKLGPQVVDLWAQLLRRLPDTRLFLAAKVFEASDARERFCALFRERDVDPARIGFKGGAPHNVYMGYYNQIDVALDPFPYSGGLTTCEAMWMGVPVITLGGGDSFASRHSAGHLSRVGLDELITASPEAYIAKAEELVGDIMGLSALRHALRNRMAASPLCDCVGHTRALEAALRNVWREWCSRQA